MNFVKMHGTGNDYVFVDCMTAPGPANPEELSIAISRPHFGVGSDGLILVEPSNSADARMRMYNSDGSEAQMCGNGIRCVGKLLYERGYVKGDSLRVETLAGIKQLKLDIEGGEVRAVSVDMGVPILRPRDIPVDMDGESAVDIRVEACGREIQFTCVSVGNPHAVTFDMWPNDNMFALFGPAVERHKLFPERVNVEFARMRGRDEIEVRVWERGSGETLACGTGATATLVAAVMKGLSERSARVILPGGALHINWDESDGHVWMKGPAITVFTGVWPD